MSLHTAAGMTSAGLFNERGNPWVTSKDRQNEWVMDVGEDADLDQYTKAVRSKRYSGMTVVKARKDTERSRRDPQAMKLLNLRLKLKATMKG